MVCMDEGSQFLTKVGAAKLLGINRRTLDLAIKAGVIPATIIGKRLVIPRAPLERLAGRKLPDVQ